MWGQVIQYLCENCMIGIIPTRVGTRRRRRQAENHRRDHPHACGDKAYTGSFPDRAGGSSPRVWGQEIFNLYDTMAIRIIPTRVGTSLKEKSTNNLSQDHPHACGDKLEILSVLLSLIGSSPRVWGQVHLREVLDFL